MTPAREGPGVVLRARRRREALLRLLPLAIGAALLVGATVAGGSDAFTLLLVSPPPAVRLLLGTAAALLGVVLVLRSADRLREHRDPRDLVRAVRIVFLAVAAFAAAAGWYLASPLPIIAGLVIAAVDILETSLLLLVTAVRGAPPVADEGR